MFDQGSITLAYVLAINRGISLLTDAGGGGANISISHRQDELVSQELFRREAIHAQTVTSLGVVRLATPISHQVWGISALAMAIGILAWLFVGHYTRREHVVGSLVPQAGLLVVNARTAGTLTKLNVAEGAEVSAGDALLTISGDRSSVSMGETAAAISTQQHRVKDHLESAIVDTSRIGDEQEDDLRMQQRMLRSQIKQLDEQADIQHRQVQDLTAMLHRLQALGTKGYVSALDVQQQRTQELNAEEQVKSLMRQRSESERQLNSIGDQLAQLPLVTAGKLNDLQRQMAQNEQALVQNEVDRATVLRAPEGGVVSAVLIKQGQTVIPGQSLLAVMPRGSVLQAQLLVPSSAIGFVHRGTSVVLHYQAFPYQKFGVQHGTVIDVSRSALTPTEVTGMLGQQPPEESLYQVRVRLAHQDIRVYGRSEPLKPGMMLDAELLLDRRRMIEWIFEPLYGMARRAEGDG